MIRIALLAGVLLLSGCAPAAGTTVQREGAWNVMYNTAEQKTSIQKMSLDDGTDCYVWYGEFSCVKR